jgi:predicted permease
MIEVLRQGGHWIAADLGIILVFLIAILIVAGLGWYVVRATMRNRSGEP